MLLLGCAGFRGAGGIVGSFVLLTGHCVVLVVLRLACRPVCRHCGFLMTDGPPALCVPLWLLTG